MKKGSKKYGKLLADLKLKMMSGELPEGSYLPSENDLSRVYGLSRPTVRKAIAELSGEGFIRTIPGKGSQVLGTEHLELKVTVLKLYWILPSHEYPLIKKIIKRFNAEHRHIQVQLITFDTYSLPPFFTEEAMDSTAVQPDLICLTNRLMLHLQSSDLNRMLLPLNDRMEADKARIYPFLWSPLMQNGQTYAMPITFSPLMLMYNQTMFEQAGVPLPHNDWVSADLTRAAVRLTKENPDGTMQYGFSFSPSFFRWPLFFMQEGGKFVEDGRSFPLSGGQERGIRFILDLLYKHRVSPLVYRSMELSEQFFYQGKAAMMMSTYYLDGLHRESSFRWGICRFPAGSCGQSLAISTSIGIIRQSPHAEEAAYFLNYLVSEDIQAFIKKNSTTLPAVRSVAEEEQFPHDAFTGDGYYHFKSALHDIRLVNDLGLSIEEMTRLNEAMEMVWFRIQPFREVWARLSAP